MFKNEGVTRIQKITAQVEKGHASAYGLLKQEALHEFMHGEELSVENWIRNDAFADVATQSILQQVMLVISLNRLTPRVASEGQKEIFVRSLTHISRQLQGSGHPSNSQRTANAMSLLRKVFCAQYIYSNVNADVTDGDWIYIDDEIGRLARKGGWEACAFLIAMRYILHPGHPRPTEGQMNMIREDAKMAFTSLTNSGIYLFCLKLLDPENFPQVAGDEWLAPFELTGVREKNFEDFAFLLMAASDLSLEGTMLKISPPNASAAAPNPTAIPQPRHI